jgi:hypothetical protein
LWYKKWFPIGNYWRKTMETALKPQIVVIGNDDERKKIVDILMDILRMV